MRNKWKIKNDHNFILDNFVIDEGINNLIGKNNNGKSRFARYLQSNKLKIESFDNKEVKITYIPSLSTTIDSESVKKDRITEGKIEDFITNDRIETPIDDFIYPYWSDEIKKFLKNKKVFKEEINKSKVFTTIDGFHSGESGTGENRLTLFIYVVGEILNQISEIDNSLTNEQTVIKFSDEKIQRQINLFKESLNINIEEENYNFYIESFKDLINLTEDYVLRRILFKIIRQITEMHNPFITNLIYEWSLSNLDIFGIKENHKDLFVSQDIIRNYLLNNEEFKKTIPNILLIIDEPENYIHRSKIKMFFDIINSLFETEIVDVRVILITHSELIYTNSDSITKTNLIHKNRNYFTINNIFSSNIESFVDGVIDDAKRILDRIDKCGANDSTNYHNFKYEFEVLNKFRIEYITHVLSDGDNLKILFLDDEITLVEGYTDKLFQEIILDVNNSIETKGIHIKLLIWLSLININKENFEKIKIFIDFDYKVDNGKPNLVNEEVKNIIFGYINQGTPFEIYNPPIKGMEHALKSFYSDFKSRTIPRIELEESDPNYEDNLIKYWNDTVKNFISNFKEYNIGKKETFKMKLILNEIKNNKEIFNINNSVIGRSMSMPSISIVNENKKFNIEKFQKWFNTKNMLNVLFIRDGVTKFKWSDDITISFENKLVNGILFDSITNDKYEHEVIIFLKNKLFFVDINLLYDFVDNFENKYPNRIFAIDDVKSFEINKVKSHSFLVNTLLFETDKFNIILDGSSNKYHIATKEDKIKPIVSLRDNQWTTFEYFIDNFILSENNATIWLLDYNMQTYELSVINKYIELTENKEINIMYILFNTENKIFDVPYNLYLGPFRHRKNISKDDISNDIKKITDEILKKDSWNTIDILNYFKYN